MFKASSVLFLCLAFAYTEVIALECPEGRTGIFPVLTDCTSYLKCFRGKGGIKACPEGFRFDSTKHCTPDADADCGFPTPEQKEINSYCQEYFGMFPYPPDCHKYVVCDQGRGTVRVCPDNLAYSDITGCVVDDQCP